MRATNVILQSILYNSSDITLTTIFQIEDKVWYYVGMAYVKLNHHERQCKPVRDHQQKGVGSCLGVDDKEHASLDTKVGVQESCLLGDWRT